MPKPFLLSLKCAGAECPVGIDVVVPGEGDLKTGAALGSGSDRFDVPVAAGGVDDAAMALSGRFAVIDRAVPIQPEVEEHPPASVFLRIVQPLGVQEEKRLRRLSKMALLDALCL